MICVDILLISIICCPPYKREAQKVKNLPTVQEIQIRSLVQEDTLEKGMATHSSILARESRGQRSLEGYSPWGCKESDTDMAEHLTLSVRCRRII